MKPDDFDPAWTVVQAHEASQAVLAADPQRNPADPTLPFSRWAASKRLDELARDHAAGDKRALMSAIRECARCDLPLPEWAAKAYIRAFDSVLNCRVKSWDDAFGAPFPKGVQLHALRRRRLNRLRVHREVLELIKGDPLRPIDAGLFEEVGRKFHMAKTAAERLYYEAEKMGFVSASEWKKRNGWK